MKRPALLSLLLLPVLGCPKQDGGTTTATPVPTATAAEPLPDKGKGRVQPEEVPAETMLKAVNGWGGIYKNLLAVIHAPEDRANWSVYSEYGWKDAYPYKEYGAMPAGWWVYVDPYWFIWDTKNGEREEGGSGAAIPSDGKFPPAGERNGLIDFTTLPEKIVFRAAIGADAKYTNILAAIQDPDSAKEWRAFSEQGWKATGDFKDYGQVPAGWWVYAEPYWVIWNLKDGKQGP